MDRDLINEPDESHSLERTSTRADGRFLWPPNKRMHMR